MDPIKLAFSKIKKDISLLNNEIAFLKEAISKISDAQILLDKAYFADKQTNQQTHDFNNLPLEGVKTTNILLSTGNKGVPTDKQTNQQTNQQTQNNSEKLLTKGFFEFKQANKIFNSLEGLKKETALAFKQLTPQEMLVFTTLYQLEDQRLTQITYRTLANSLNLSESSIRDYITKISKKGIPIEKTKKNNKTIFLSISNDLKNLVSLDTILAFKGF